jgi:hypothetical protein
MKVALGTAILILGLSAQTVSAQGLSRSRGNGACGGRFTS